MNLVKLGNGPDTVWVNTDMIAWFWNYDGKIAIKMTGQHEMLTVKGVVAEDLDRRLTFPI